MFANPRSFISVSRAIGLTIITAIASVAFAVCFVAALPIANSAVCGDASYQALAMVGGELQAGSPDSQLSIQGTEPFSASAASLDLSPKQKKIANGTQYISKRRTVTVTAPSSYSTVYWNTTDPHVATAQWVGKWSGNTTKLRITGHARGNATIIITNNKTKEKVRIKVTVGGYKLKFRWQNAKEKVYVKADGTNGYYKVNRFKIINKTGKRVVFDKKCVVKCWTVYEDDTYAVRNTPYKIRSLPVTVKNNKSKIVYIGEREYADKNGNYPEPTYWKKGCFTVKVGKAYKTVYVDMYGMVTKVRNGRDF